MLYSERLRFRAIEREDLPRFVAWFNDPEVRRGLAKFLPLSMAREEQWFSKMLELPPEEHPFLIEAAHADSWTPIGSCSLHGIDQRNRSAPVGIAIGEKTYWNRGYGAEAMRLLLRHGFATLNLYRIWLHVYESNPRAIRAYEKVGFVLEGRLRQACYREGRYEDVLVMSVLRHEWEEAAASP